MSDFKDKKEIAPGFFISNYGQEREINATPGEKQIAEWILNEFPDENLRLVRVSSEYVTIKRGEWDIVRMKYTDRAKWLMFPSIESGKKKYYIEDAAEVEDFVASIDDSIETAKRFE